MKNRVCLTPLTAPFPSAHRSHTFSGAVHRPGGTRARRQRRLLLGMSILLIFSWTIVAIWLINVRRGERSTVEVRAQQETIVALFPGK